MINNCLLSLQFIFETVYMLPIDDDMSSTQKLLENFLIFLMQNVLFLSFRQLVEVNSDFKTGYISRPFTLSFMLMFCANLKIGLVI